jgi:hypothetical protein
VYPPDGLKVEFMSASGRAEALVTHGVERQPREDLNGKEWGWDSDTFDDILAKRGIKKL